MNKIRLEQRLVPKLLELIRLGNPILQTPSRQITPEDIKSPIIQNLIENIRYTNETKKYGVGLAAPQVGESIALSVIGIKPTPTRPNLAVFDSVIINPTYAGVGKRTGKWEGCQSSGSGDDILYAKALRYSSINATWYDENAVLHSKQLNGFVAHVFQHETDHLQGVLFVDKVRDTKTYMMADEYRKRIIKR